jgi:hypothetical protein
MYADVSGLAVSDIHQTPALASIYGCGVLDGRSTQHGTEPGGQCSDANSK